MTGNRRELGGSFALGRGTCTGRVRRETAPRRQGLRAAAGSRRGAAAAIAPGVDQIDTAQYDGADTVTEQKTGGRSSE
jgi:hypothetical protein